MSVSAHRIQSIDLVRGLVMVLMALDHVRDFVHAPSIAGADPLDPATTTIPFYLTRWITHFCAPTFVFLSGTSIFLSLIKAPSLKHHSKFLLTRGLWLLAVEFTLVAFGWLFRFPLPVVAFQVIGAIGMSMICMAALIHLRVRYLAWIGVVIVVGHNAFDGVTFPAGSALSILWSFLHVQSFVPITDSFGVMVIYPFVPWLGIMILGYCLGRLYLPSVDPGERRHLLSRMGISAIGLFIIVRLVNAYGDLEHWVLTPTQIGDFMSFLDTTKYPPSLLYTLMTLGPMLIVLSNAERWSKGLSKVMITFGRVPMFYYVAHIYLAHAVGFALALSAGYAPSTFYPATSLFGFPLGFGYDLGVTYVVWLAVLVALYPVCRWFDKLKTQRRDVGWLRYL
jgi:uncharacterized membrane protein